MKKSRAILAIILALVLLLTMSIAVACDNGQNPGPGDQGGDQGGQGSQGNQDGNDPQPEGTWALQKITISGNYKREYQLNETFSAEGLTVSASMMNTATKATRTDNVTSQAKVDSSRFNSAMVGTYVITISYTNIGVTRYADYRVTVAPYEPAINGISMTKETVDYDIPSGHLTVGVNLDDITVKAIDANGEEEANALAADAYTLSFYKGGQKIDSLENVARGSYTIQAERKSDGQKAFVIVNVNGGLESITASTTQETVELANESATVEINKQDITVKTDSGAVVVADATNGPCIALSYKLYSVVDDAETALDTWTVGAGTYKVKVTATYNNPATESTVDFTAEVTITVKVKAASTSQYHNYKLLADANIAGTYTAETIWLAEDEDNNSVSITAATNANVVVESNSKKASDGTALTHRIKLGGAGTTSQRSIKITVTEITTITIYTMSSSSSEARTVMLVDSNGNDVLVSNGATLEGTVFTADTKVDGADVRKIVVTVEAGTYYFYSQAKGLNVYGINLEIGIA